jgi:hypothetical protein
LVGPPFGSANVSASSEDALIEAGCQVTNPDVVAECRTFVQSLGRSSISSPTLISETGTDTLPHNYPANIPSSSQSAVAVSLKEIDYDATDESAADRAHRSSS